MTTIAGGRGMCVGVEKSGLRRWNKQREKKEENKEEELFAVGRDIYPGDCQQLYLKGPLVWGQR